MENRYKNVFLIGTSHIAQDSIHKINSAFNNFQPDIIAVELDAKRLYGLQHNIKPDYSLRGIGTYGLQGYLFAIIGSFVQKKLGNIVGIKPGADMLAAVNLALSNKKHLALIDQNIEITLRRFSKDFTFKEKMRLFADIIKAPFGKKMKFDLRTIPEKKIIHELIGQLRARYPNLYRVLIEERNQTMAKNIYHLMTQNPEKKILVVIGAGHEEGLVSLIKKEEYKRDRVR